MTDRRRLTGAIVLSISEQTRVVTGLEDKMIVAIRLLNDGDLQARVFCEVQETLAYWIRNRTSST